MNYIRNILNSRSTNGGNFFLQLKKIIGFKPKNKTLPVILTVIHPSYFPSIPLCARVAASDVIVWADSFLFKKQSDINRTPIKTINGKIWLSIPVLQKGLGQQEVRAAKIDNHQPWSKKHLHTLEKNYRNSPYFYQYWDELSRLFLHVDDFLDPFLFRSASFIFDKFLFSKKIILSSDLPQVKNRSRRVVAWLKATHCDTYLMVRAEKPLIDLHNRYNLSFFQFTAKIYHQQYFVFIYPLSALDLLLNEGPFSIDIISKGIDIQPYSEDH